MKISHRESTVGISIHDIEQEQERSDKSNENILIFRSEQSK